MTPCSSISPITEVVNIHSGAEYDIYIARPRVGEPRNPLANNYHLNIHGDRPEVIRKFAVDFPLMLRTDPEFRKAVERTKGRRLGCFCAPSECHGHVYVIYHEMGLDGVARVANGESVSAILAEIDEARKLSKMTTRFSWKRRGGYEVSSVGDKRFSALHAKMADGRTIEMHYQLDVKGYDPGGRNWRLGKGKPPLVEVDLWEAYLALWREWSQLHLPLMRVLYIKARDESGGVLSDCFASTPVSQARALAVILNELQGLPNPDVEVSTES